MLLFSITAIPVLAATETEIEDSIALGLAWLVPQQNGDGSWGVSQKVAHTRLAVTKLFDRAYETGFDPYDPAYMYSSNVIAGLDYIFSQSSAVHGVGTIVYAPGGRETYNTGIAMMAIASSRTPAMVVSVGNPAVDGMTHKQVLEDCGNYFVMFQNPDGGWRYVAGPQPSDNSTTGYAVLGLRYAEDYGCTIPASLKNGLNGLNNWIDYIETNPLDPGHNADTDGGSGYTGPGDGWVNTLKTGNLLFEMSFVGDDKSTVRAQRAIDYIVRHWNDNNPNPGWRIDYQAM